MVKPGSVPTEVGPSDSLVLHISGIKPGSGRVTPTNIVSDSYNLSQFLDAWGDGSTDVPVYDHAELAKLAQKDAALFQQKMAEITEALSGATADPLPDRIVNAVCKFLAAPEEEGGKNMLIADEDPGSDVWFISKADLQPTVRQFKGDGYQWSVVETAPFG